MAKQEFVFVKWLYDKHLAVFKDTLSGKYFVVPKSRLIPHPICEYKHSNIRDPNLLSEICTEENSLFGIAIFRHFLHKLKLHELSDSPDRVIVTEEDIEKAYDFPLITDFSCVRDCILRGGDTDLCIAECS